MARGFDYRQFNDWKKHMEKASTEFDQWLLIFLNQEGERFIAQVKPRTPVDTGDLRNHWQIEGIKKTGSELYCWFVNPMEYATPVEYGHAPPYMSGKVLEGEGTWVEGYFMMTVSLEYIDRTMPTRFEKEFKEFLLSLGAI